MLRSMRYALGVYCDRKPANYRLHKRRAVKREGHSYKYSILFAMLLHASVNGILK